MNFHKISLLFLTVFLLNSFSEASVQNKKDDSKLLEELTGKKTPVAAAVVQKNRTPVVAQNSSVTVSRRLLDAGFYAYTKKDYISALKYYNTIIVKHAQTKELHLAYLAKSKLYQEMGLIEQAQLNLKKANEIKSSQIVK